MNTPELQRREFSADGALPAGVVALEASAGTGKTYALTALATRFIAECQVSASQLCMVTFTEAATTELRGRLRDRISETATHLDGLIAGTATEIDDPVVTAIADTSPEQRIIRRDALRRALAEFDTATISTIHGFCTRVLAGRGSEAQIVTSGAAQIAEAVGDVALAAIAEAPDLELRPDRLIQGASQSLAMPSARLVSAYVDRDHEGLRSSQLDSVTHTDQVVEVTELAVAEVLKRRVERAERTFDALLSETRDLLAGPEAAMVIRSLRDRFRIVLIDEFQDTDQVQWEIFRRAFIDPAPDRGATDEVETFDGDESVAAHRAVVIVGDPKQSIYRFRSAEITAYLDAVTTADEMLTLSTNWRSDAPLLEGLEALMADFEFGSPEVVFTPVSAAKGHEEAGLRGDDGTAVQLRVIDTGDDQAPPADQTKRAVRRDLIGVVQGLLGGDMVVKSGDRERALEARDIAILTRSNADGRIITELLSGVGIPAASSSGGSVLESMATQQWQVLLRALDRPGAIGPARAAALGWFLGISPVRLADFSDADALELHETLRRWRSELRRGGIAALLAAARAAGLSRRVLGRAGGERDLTDLDHVAELLQSLTSSRSPATLLAALATAARTAEEDRSLGQLTERRIDRDDDAVQIMTIHGAKGLEFPVVLVPFLWTGSAGGSSLPHAVIDGQRCLDGSWIAGYDASRNQGLRSAATAEQAAEARRLLYVALTRARHRCIIWWGRDRGKSGGRPLKELLQHRLGIEPLTIAHLEPLVRAAPDTISTAAVPIDIAAPHSTGVADDSAGGRTQRSDESTLGVSGAWRTEFEPSWRIWSFTSIVNDAAHRASSSRHDPNPDAIPVLGGTDEAIADGSEPVIIEPIGTPLADAPAGAAFGTLMHQVLERADFTAEPVTDHLVELCDEALARRPLAIDAASLANGLAHALHTPLGGPLGSFALTELQRGDRLDELEFHLPLGRLRASDLAAVLVEHLDHDDPIRPWATRLVGPDSGDPGSLGEFAIDLAGRLTGSIDLTFRHRDGDTDRYFVADYKSNRLAHRAAYGSAELVEAMVHHHYPLQAALYLVALHRYLRWRLVDYDPAVHLGGAAYLFIRGMDPGAGEPGHGVFWWTPATDAVLALDAVLGADGAVGSMGSVKR